MTTHPTAIAASSHPLGAPEPLEAGQLLADLEQRQDDVLVQLDELDAKLKAILKENGVTLDENEADDAIPRPVAA